jgi:hypothetical protein
MELGGFSISLAAKDITASKAFYEKLGFKPTLGAGSEVRELQRRLKAQSVQMATEADESTTGPASFVSVDPEGNPILVDPRRSTRLNTERRQ